MSRRLAILCPGQGAQHAQMFDVLGNGGPAALLADEWRLREALGMPPEQALNEASRLYANRSAQPLIVAASLMAWEAVRNVLPMPSLVAGYSIGELTAYAVAESLAAQDAIALAAIRATAMDACKEPGQPQAMLAVSGIALPLLREMLAPAAMSIAIETGEDSAVVGGLRQDADAVRESVEQRGARVTALPVEVASHTPLMHAAVAPFLAELRQRKFSNPHLPVVCGISAENIRDKERAIDTLARQLSETIVWQQCMDNFAEAGITIALELGPGNALSRMLSQRHPQIACRAACEFRSVAGVASWVGRHFGE
ncbi:ACP S-malonyltransferase [Noviherbaspirillum aerium]|uniref:ACP S-malonyltransferase n=1 Tax=Noviherbaspirillum aerium TaxID=2588497 RepID=UPI00124EAF28|nr:acyltransferase domain-containing protein [Noviherbaspirillum aerium]